MQSLASSPHLAQSLDPTHHSIIEPNPTQPTTVAKKFDSTRPDSSQSNPTRGWTMSISALAEALGVSQVTSSIETA